MKNDPMQPIFDRMAINQKEITADLLAQRKKLKKHSGLLKEHSGLLKGIAENVSAIKKHLDMNGLPE